MAIAHWIFRFTEEPKDHPAFQQWLRHTVGYPRRQGKWLRVHEHRSLPFDPHRSMAVLTLELRINRMWACLAGGSNVQVSVLVEPVAGNGFRAKEAEPFGLSADGATREEAIAKVRQLCQARLNGGAEVVTVDLGGPSTSLVAVCRHVQG